MNKLLLSSEDDFENLVFEEDTDLVVKLNDVSKNINIIVEDNICLNVIELSYNTKNKISFVLKENSRVFYNRAVKNCSDSISIDLDGISSSIDMNNSIMNDVSSISNFYIKHNNSSTLSNISNHGINNSKYNLEFNVNAIINSCGKNSITKQENKIININCGKSKILPNLIVDIDDVDASHSAYISDLDKDSKFYMNSRGIDSVMAKELLIKSFLLGNLNNFEEYINEAKSIFGFK